MVTRNKTYLVTWSYGKDNSCEKLPQKRLKIKTFLLVESNLWKKHNVSGTCWQLLYYIKLHMFSYSLFFVSQIQHLFSFVRKILFSTEARILCQSGIFVYLFLWRRRYNLLLLWAYAGWVEDKASKRTWVWHCLATFLHPEKWAF